MIRMDKEKLIVLLACASLYGLLVVGFFLGLNESMLYRFLALAYVFLATHLSVVRIFGFDRTASVFLTPLFSALPIMIVGSGLYLFSGLYQWTVCVLLALPLIIVLSTPNSGRQFHFSFPRMRPVCVILFGIFLLLEAASLYLLLHNMTVDSVLGPWNVVPPSFFALFFSASLLLFPLLFRLGAGLSFFALSMHFFTAFSVATIIFPLGFGFDPHLHRATEKLIVEQGVVTPKTFYYVGQYVLVGFWSKLITIDVRIVDKLLSPVLAATAVPVLAAHALRTYFSLPFQWGLVGALLVLLFPFSYGISTTPWALAFLFGICISFGILRYLQQKSKTGMVLCILLSVAALTVHPLAGLPLLGASIVAYCRPSVWRWIITSFFAVSIPLALLANAALSSQFSVVPRLHMGLFASLVNTFSLEFGTRFHAILDPVYLFHNNYLILFLAFSFLGLYCAKKKLNGSILFIVSVMSIILINALLIALFLFFPELISYEQREYSMRLVQLSLVFLLPFFLFALITIVQKIISSRRATLACASILMSAGLLTANLYSTYPRNDAFASFHGYSISHDDIQAVRFISQDAGEIPYIVLANQVVAAAAVKEFGFKTYYTVSHRDVLTELFYYPIPTSSSLHTAYREMLENPDRAIAQGAAELFSVQRVYFVVNAYEDRFQNIIDAATKTANSVVSFREKDYVFRYDMD
ncbi:hypothetical protein HY620_00255 [Candidatus Uhrbacteria bacterium]|nr:hypothetical protein [Candidatus Uhrbacteria bacterium]